MPAVNPRPPRLGPSTPTPISMRPVTRGVGARPTIHHNQRAEIEAAGEERIGPVPAQQQERVLKSFHAITLAVLAAGSLLPVAGVLPAAALDISGAGATFPYPIYAKWADADKKETGVGLNYQSIGSGGGIKQIENKTVTFGASDMPLKPAELNKAGLVQFPTVMGGDVPVVNIEGIKSGDLKLDGDTLAKIFLGEIKAWNDPAILKLNPNAKLPSQPIVAVHRSDGSGTTFIWTDYLSKVSADWKSKVGA